MSNIEHTIRKNTTWSIFSFFFFLVALGSPGGIFRIHAGMASLLLLLGWLNICWLTPFIFRLNYKALFSFGAFVIAFFATYGRHANIFGVINNFLYTSTFFFLFALKDEYKQELLQFLTKWTSLFLLVSFVVWTLWIVGVNIPSFQYIPNQSLAENSMYVFRHHYFFLRFDYEYFNANISPRFQAFFIEPGYLGTICLLLIAANDFNFRNRHVCLLFGIMLVSCSLAAYVIFCITFSLSLFCKKKYLFLLLIAVMGITFVGTLLICLPEDNLLRTYIFDRLFSEEGINYNRSNEVFEAYFFNDFCQSWNLLLGSDYGIELAKETRSVDFKMFMVYYGLVGFLIYVLFLFFCFCQYRNRKTFCLTVVFGLILLQSSWLAQYLIYIGTYILGLSRIDAAQNANNSEPLLPDELETDRSTVQT